MSEESDEDSGTATWTYTLNAYYTGAFLGEDGHLIKEAVPSADTDADTDTDSVEGEEQTNGIELKFQIPTSGCCSFSVRCHSGMFVFLYFQ